MKKKNKVKSAVKMRANKISRKPRKALRKAPSEFIKPISMWFYYQYISSIIISWLISSKSLFLEFKCQLEEKVTTVKKDKKTGKSLFKSHTGFNNWIGNDSLDEMSKDGVHRLRQITKVKHFLAELRRKKISRTPNAKCKTANNFEFEISMLEGVYSPKIDHIFQDFGEESQEELSSDLRVNGTVGFVIHEMDLKKL
jgi:hypothetical protein